MINYSKAWSAMNKLEQIITKISNVTEIVDSATEAIERGDFKKATALNYAVNDYLEVMLNEFDDTFKTAWNETIKKINDVPLEVWNVKVEKDLVNDDLYINLPQDLCDSISLDEGDQLAWYLRVGSEDQWIVKKINSNLE